MKKTIPFVVTFFMLLGSFCSHEEEMYVCNKTSAELPVSLTFANIGCSELPLEVKTKIKGLLISSANEELSLYFYSSNDTAGLQVKFSQNKVDLFYNSALLTSSNSIQTNTAKDYCIEIHDVQKEAHLQIFEADCNTLITEFSQSALFSINSRQLSYKRTASAIFSELSIESEGAEH